MTKDGRQARADIADETVSIIAAGWYAHGGRKEDVVHIAEPIRRSVASTAVINAEQSVHAHDGCGTARKPCRIRVGEFTTLAAARELVTAGHDVVVLNFASAKRPGGGFTRGANAQEENLARNTTLYAALSRGGEEFYAAHRRQKDPLYSDAVIYSPRVSVIREEQSSALLAEPWETSIITAAAPNAGVARAAGVDESTIDQVYLRRAARVLEVAKAYGHDAVVLGAWGCGVFQNSPWGAARAFASLLTEQGRYAHAFQEVVFAIIGPVENRAPFEECFIGTEFTGAGSGASYRPASNSAEEQRQGAADVVVMQPGASGLSAKPADAILRDNSGDPLVTLQR
mmetsp:Transcript_6675/g.18089  ORF Transcript_6675/g.18089 Transcript_6675/m.18089 type:complete len:342 (-) Transcript_6675:287-1312(-)|eukprot:CAMPEP_0185209460 /NCGR_PEP_ID=MMETSP1140-20130426/63801_1 /TAXON_ID=298111 /ORGANISM="Pavlova sp., Strain CCMP459" /LENGTH=341 /DNA_ID=CAMNT_0027777221 /DNA_START=176 /DNA_END=1201 /DNA_ORIENTATION=-